MLPLTAGTVLHDRYRVVRLIGKGGMGAVYESIDCRLQNTVAVKQVVLADVVAASAFEREARLLAGLRHAALPVVIDHFVDAHGQFLVMQYIEGDDLSRLLAHRQHPCAIADVVEWGRTILRALAYLHEHEPPVVHRDVKPANLRRTPRGEIVLLDFGLAKGGREDETRLAGDRSVFGYTRRYAPPEQIAGRGTDARSDLYSLGATLLHLATGAAPPDATERLQAVEAGRPDPLAGRIAGLSRQSAPLGRAIARAMEIAPGDRFGSAREMLRALEDARAGAGSPDSAVAPAAREPGARRIDAAMPSQVEVGRQVDLLLQVRFDRSPLLGLEDWPARRRPEQIEQRSERFRISYPQDPSTRRLLPARLRVKLAAPDFLVAGDAERIVDVPPDNYSPRLAFLLTARRPGTCRVNVEVYTAENVFVGSVPIEAEGVGAAVAEPELQVANLVLEILARRAQDAQVLAMRRSAETAAAPALQGANDPIGDILPHSRITLDEARRAARAPAAAAAATAPSRVSRTGLRRAALLTPVLVAAFGAGWLMFRGQHAEAPTSAPPIASAQPPTTSTAVGSSRPSDADLLEAQRRAEELSRARIDPKDVERARLAEQTAQLADERARLAAQAARLVDERAIRAALDAHRRELEAVWARSDAPISPALRTFACLARDEAGQPRVVFESTTRARVACADNARREPPREGPAIVLEKRDGVWIVVSK